MTKRVMIYEFNLWGQAIMGTTFESGGLVDLLSATKNVQPVTTAWPAKKQLWNKVEDQSWDYRKRNSGHYREAPPF